VHCIMASVAARTRKRRTAELEEPSPEPQVTQMILADVGSDVAADLADEKKDEIVEAEEDDGYSSDSELESDDANADDDETATKR